MDPVLTKERIESLRLILEAERKCFVSTVEAEEIGRGLIAFFENLLNNDKDLHNEKV
jgi:hypothetical protein